VIFGLNLGHYDISLEFLIEEKSWVITALAIRVSHTGHMMSVVKWFSYRESNRTCSAL
jgi:hypothetical protein